MGHQQPTRTGIVPGSLYLGKFMLKKGDIVELKVPLMFSGYKGKAVVAENQWTESVCLHKVDDQEFRFLAMRHEVSKKRQ